MKTLNFNGEKHQAEKIVKSSDSIIGYTSGVEVFSFRGISNFYGFELDEGQEFDKPEQSELEKLRVEMARSNTQMMEFIITVTGGM